MHNPTLRQIIRIGVMLGNPIIPNSHVILLPTPAHLKFGFRRVSKQESQQSLTFFSA